MSDSQALQTAIGLVLMFFVIALASSTLVETVAQVFKLRARDLEAAIGQMLAGGTGPDPASVGDLSDAERQTHDLASKAVDEPLTPDVIAAVRASRTVGRDTMKAAAEMFKGTSVYTAAMSGAERGYKVGKPSYLAARSFADGVAEMTSLVKSADQLPPGLLRRLQPLVDEAESVHSDAQTRALHIRSGIEHWFDETMNRLQGAYKRWTSKLLFAFGLAITVLANASTFHVAQRLWHDPTTASAVASAAASVDDTVDLNSIAETTDQLQQLNLPVGWDDQTQSLFTDHLWSWATGAVVLGWLVTGLLVMLGAPFWFDLLTRLSTLRSAGKRPSEATGDPASATSLLTDGAATATRAPADRGPVVDGEKLDDGGPGTAAQPMWWAAVRTPST